MRTLVTKIKQSIRSPFWALFIPYGWLLLFFLIPFLIVLKISFADLKVGLPPYGPLMEWVEVGVLNVKLNFTNYTFIGHDPLYLFSYFDSLWIAIIGTL